MAHNSREDYEGNELKQGDVVGLVCRVEGFQPTTGDPREVLVAPVHTRPAENFVVLVASHWLERQPIIRDEDIPAINQLRAENNLGPLQLETKPADDGTKPPADETPRVLTFEEIEAATAEVGLFTVVKDFQSEGKPYAQGETVELTLGKALALGRERVVPFVPSAPPADPAAPQST